jgi:integrase
VVAGLRLAPPSAFERYPGARSNQARTRWILCRLRTARHRSGVRAQIGRAFRWLGLVPPEVIHEFRKLLLQTANIVGEPGTVDHFVGVGGAFGPIIFTAVRANEGRLAGTPATPKGLRHGFGVNAFQSNVPPHLVQRWLGHASLKTTAIYGDVMGSDERAFAARMWKR